MQSGRGSGEFAISAAVSEMFTSRQRAPMRAADAIPDQLASTGTRLPGSQAVAGMRHGMLPTGQIQPLARTVGIEIADRRLVTADWPVTPITDTAGSWR